MEKKDRASSRSDQASRRTADRPTVGQQTPEQAGRQAPEHSTHRQASRASHLREGLSHAGRRARGALVAVAVVAALVVGLAIGHGGLTTPGATHVDATTIKNSFNDVAELAVQEYDFANVGKYSQDDMKILDLSIPFTGKSFLVTYEGSVKAGIRDVSQATVDVDDDAQTVTVALPDVEVLDSHIDSDSVKTYDQTFNPINQMSVDDVTSFIAGEEQTREDEAVSSGLLDKARTRAEALVRSNVQAVLAGTPQADYAVDVTWQQA